MATSSPLPQTTREWIQKLDTVRLPVLEHEARQARSAFVDPDRSLREIGQLIQATPVLALAIVREANRNTGSMERAESLEAALTRIGLDRAQELLKRIPVTKLTEENRPFFQMLLISRHATQQARGLFANRLARLWQEVHWNSLLFLAPIWAIVGAYPELLDRWEERLLTQPSSRQDEVKTLGLPLLNLCLSLAQHWQLPSWIIHGYTLLNNDLRLLVKATHIAQDQEQPSEQQRQLGEDPELRRWLSTPENTPLLVNALAMTAHQGWGTQQALRWQQLSALYTQQPLAALQQQAHQYAVTSAHNDALAGLWHPAQALIWPWNTLATRSKKLAEPLTRHAPEDTTKNWRTLCLELLKTPSPFGNPLQLLATARDAFLAGGAQRALLLQFDPQRQLLISRQTYGLGSEANYLQVDPAHSQLLKHLLESPRQVLLNGEATARLFHLLPGAIKSSFTESPHLLIRSLATQGRVTTLAVLDQNGFPLDEKTLQCIAKTIPCVERALDQYALAEP